MATKAYAQVYSLIRQDRTPQLLYDALAKFSKMGYDGIEGIGANTAGLSMPDFKKYLADLNLDMCSVMNLSTDEELAYGAFMGARYDVAGFRPKSLSRDDILRACDEVNEFSRKVKAAGMMNLIHNHAHEFGQVEGEPEGVTPYDLILQNTDPDLVGMEIDVGWVQFAGANPVDIIKKYPGRFRIIHVKECNRIAKDAEEREHFPKKVLDMGPPKFINGAPKFSPIQEKMMYEARNFNVELGNGLIDWPALAAAAKGQGFPVYFVSEREYYHCYGADGNEDICAQKDCDFIHSL
ncbi:MAG: sugar phosphate isomerase/epimerase [Oscillospiraceae bacterium]|nr:sugar phosphate isomerase/epimerase [Oscillospiraceae bacterium]